MTDGHLFILKTRVYGRFTEKSPLSAVSISQNPAQSANYGSVLWQWTVEQKPVADLQHRVAYERLVIDLICLYEEVHLQPAQSQQRRSWDVHFPTPWSRDRRQWNIIILLRLRKIPPNSAATRDRECRGLLTNARFCDECKRVEWFELIIGLEMIRR